MKLRNKKTGEIKEIEEVLLLKHIKNDGLWEDGKYNSLAELNEEWEDAPEEPKEHWYINYLCEVDKLNIDENFTDAERSLILDRQLEIGNYFETKEEAERAVDKLKALKRLKDAGVVCMVTDRDYRDKYFSVRFKIKNPSVYQEEDSHDVTEDIMLVFCGK